jgi:hypothetical protein
VAGATSVETRWLLADYQGTISDVAISECDSQDGRYETQVIDHLAYEGFGNITSETPPPTSPPSPTPVANTTPTILGKPVIGCYNRSR